MEFPSLTTADCGVWISGTQEGILLAHKKLCPHCRNMHKVLERVLTMKDSLRVALLDTEEEPEARAALNAERAPTLIFVKAGKVVKAQAGLMNPMELMQAFEQA